MTAYVKEVASRLADYTLALAAEFDLTPEQTAAALNLAALEVGLTHLHEHRSDSPPNDADAV